MHDRLHHGWNLTAALVVWGVLAACQSTRPAVAIPRPTPQPQRAPPEQSPDRLGFFEQLLCVQGKHCVEEIWEAGDDRMGRRLTVIALDRGADPDLGDEGCHEYWLVSEASTQSPSPNVSRWQLAADCDGDKWETFANVDPATKTFSHGGNSVYNVTQSRSEETIGLDPPRLIEVSESSNGVVSSDQSWNFDEFTGSSVFGIDYCPGKEPPGEVIPADRNYNYLETPAVAVPRLKLPDAFVASGWRSTALGNCAAHVDGEQRGFGSGRRTVGPDDSSMKVVLSQTGDAFVEIRDDRWSADSRDAENGDHVEIWRAEPDRDCVDPNVSAKVAKWTIRVPDGRAVDPALPVEHETATTGEVRLKIGLGARIGAGDRFTFAYVDRDDDRLDKRRIATSAITPGQWWTLGDARDLDPSFARCVVDPGKLTASVQAGLSEGNPSP